VAWTVRRVPAALVLMTILLAACTGAPPARARTESPPAPSPSTTTTTTTQPVAQPIPELPLVEDLTWVSDTHGWALVDDQGCGKPTCIEVLSTTDGGTMWSPVGSIPNSTSDCTGCGNVGGNVGVSHIRFANDLDGYAFGPGLFVTTNGGVTWSQQGGQDGPYVAALEPAGSNVMRVAYTQTGCPGPCDLTIQTAPAGSASWQTLHAPFQGDGIQLVRIGNQVAYLVIFENPAGGAQSAHATLMISYDGGAAWSTRADPCGEVGGDEYDAAAIAAASQSVLAVLCRDRQQGQNMVVALSDDGGSDFTMGRLIPGASVLSQFDQLAVTSASMVFVGLSSVVGKGTTQYLLLASDDGGRSWYQATSEIGQEVGTSPPPSPFLGFENPATGRWVAGGNDLWQTTDRGSLWSQQPPVP